VNLGRSAFEVLMLSRRSHPPIERLCAVEGEERLKAALAAGRGVIFLTGHFGNWELMAALVTRRGYPSSVVATPVYDQRLDRLLVDARARHGVHTISRGSPSAARHLLSGLRRNAILGMLIDQDTDVDGVFVPFFGRPAYTPSGPAALALKTGAAVIFGFILREGALRHRLILQGPIELIPPAIPPTTSGRTPRVHARSNNGSGRTRITGCGCTTGGNSSPRPGIATRSPNPRIRVPPRSAAGVADLPNLLTLLRLASSGPKSPSSPSASRQKLAVGAAAIFVSAAFTDWLDGYVASVAKVTDLGKLLDPIADKLLILGARDARRSRSHPRLAGHSYPGAGVRRHRAARGGGRRRTGTRR
jgi:hypothetical protein